MVRWLLVPVIYAVKYPGFFQALMLAGAAWMTMVYRRKKLAGRQ